MPADLINQHGTVTLLTQDEVDELVTQRWEANEGLFDGEPPSPCPGTHQALPS